MENRPILLVEEIHTYYGQSHILQGVTFSLGEGTIVGVLGRNGVGKTTLMRSLIGFSVPQEGRIVAQGSPGQVQSDREVQRIYFGFEENN